MADLQTLVKDRLKSGVVRVLLGEECVDDWSEQIFERGDAVLGLLGTLWRRRPHSRKTEKKIAIFVFLTMTHHHLLHISNEIGSDAIIECIRRYHIFQ